MKSTTLKAVALLLLLALIFHACQKDDFGGDSISETSFLDKKSVSVNEVRTIFAQTLVKALSNPAFRGYIHSRVQLAFESDFELIYLVEKGKVLFGDKKFSDIMTESADPKVLEEYGNDFFEKLTDITPLLAINMPYLEAFNASTWEVDYHPNVLAVLEETESEKRPYLIFGPDGRLFQRNGDDEIVTPTLTVWDAEAYYLVNKRGRTPENIHINEYMPTYICEEPVDQQLFRRAQNPSNAYQVQGKIYHLLEHNSLLSIYNIDCGGDPPPPPPPGCNEDCDRDCETLDEMTVDFKINDWGVFTNIRNQFLENKYVFHGDHLLLVRNTLNGDVSTHQGKLVTTAYKKGDLLDCNPQPCSGRFKAVNYRIWLDWMEDEVGSPYKVQWAEVDPGSSTFSTELSVSAKFKIGDNVEIGPTLKLFSVSWTGGSVVDLGSAPVFYCDDVMMNNNTNSVTFRAN